MRTVMLGGAVLVALAVGQALPALDVEVAGHGPWYASRAAGLASYLCIWAGLCGGLLMSSAWFDGLVGRARLLAIHQAATFAGLAFGLGHALVLIPDGWTSFGLVELFVPFSSGYERALMGIGTLSLYLTAVVTLSFWFRSAIGPKTWKRVHYAGFVAYGGALWHGVLLGTDSAEPWALAMYVLTAASVILGVTVRLTYRKPARVRPQGAPAGQPT